MSELMKHAQRYIERQMRDLSGDDDFLPFLQLLNDRNEIAYVGLAMPEDPDEKDGLADTITALCMVFRPVEATFASVAWMVTFPNEESAKGSVAPSRHPDRIETAFLTRVAADGAISASTANVVRENNMIGVGLWADMESGPMVIGGRFGEALQRGIALARDMPAELREFIDAELAADRMQELVERILKVTGELRSARDNAKN